MLTLEEIRKLTVEGQSVKGIMASIEAAMKNAAISGESSTTVSFARSDIPSADAWKVCREILEGRGFIVVEAAKLETKYSMAIAWPMKSTNSPSVRKPQVTSETEKTLKIKVVRPVPIKSEVVMVPASSVHVWRNRPKHIPRFDGTGRAYCNYHGVYHNAAEFGIDNSKEGGINTTCAKGQREIIARRATIPKVPKIADNGYVYCSRCSRYHPKEAFTKNKAKASGYADFCRKCAKEDRDFYLARFTERVVAEATKDAA